MFYLALTFGMADDVAGGIARMVGMVEAIGRRHGVENPIQMSLGISDGRRLYAVRYSSEGRSRTLFHNADTEALRDIAPKMGQVSADARAVVSEPLSDLPEAWIPVPESHFLTVDAGEVFCRPFEPENP